MLFVAKKFQNKYIISLPFYTFTRLTVGEVKNVHCLAKHGGFFSARNGLLINRYLCFFW